MKLTVNNLGPIKNNTQSIDLSKKFYIFVGLNNSGKTYISQLLWTIFNPTIIYKFAVNYTLDHQLNFEENKSLTVDEILIKDILDKFTNFIVDELLNNTYNLENQHSFKISLSFESELNEIKDYELNFPFPLDVNKEEYISFVKEKDSLKFNIEKNVLSQDLTNLINEITVGSKDKKYDEREYVNNLNIGLILAIFEILLKQKYYTLNTLFLPASRVFYPIFYKYIFEIERRKQQESINRFYEIVLKESQGKETKSDELRNIIRLKRSYTEPINHLLEKIYSLNQKTSVINDYNHLIKELAQIMGGDIVLQSVEGISPIEFNFKMGDKDNYLPMYLASSSVNQLSLLYLYFKYWVKEDNNFLIMDEPEENLHPENQIKLLDVLMQFAIEKNNKVLVTTHSPIFADTVNMFIYLDILKNKYGYNIKEIVEKHDLKYVNINGSLEQNEIGAYFFNGNRIIDYKSNDYGVYFRNFSNINNNLAETLRILTDYIYIKEVENE